MEVDLIYRGTVYGEQTELELVPFQNVSTALASLLPSKSQC